MGLALVIDKSALRKALLDFNAALRLRVLSVVLLK